ncbi:ABC transporter ATP-binding protein [Candidatus Falkowbacteria bacterium]|uniref:ABC transporter ATP-binding protein n=1 Tax=Candidatus Buchananbacteria bacterium CG10_big_fil_rev_8_21_14_0_10_33_19 TaxID=1974525 RepID=A0A2H0W334_9BACT|nr:ABC transporter ATP-binding protein [Candidatus Falkowbacteria bacterium]PIS05762.1 MAG: ABC transporter ATP-binding protein [Candidatus Buchananbacteria bacterium CG10_big_fil_rev_8_21_14_0_10_33_19]
MKNNTKKTLKIYWHYAWKYKVSVFVIIASIVVASLIGIIIPLYFKQFFNLLTSDQDKALIVTELINVLFIIAALELVAWIFWRFVSFLNPHFQLKVIRDLSVMCFAYLHKHSFSYFNNNFGGSLVKKVKWFTNAFESIVNETIWQLIPLVINILAIFFVLSRINLLMGLGILIWVFVFLSVNWIFIIFKLKYDIQRSEAETTITGLLSDTITNNSNVKLLNGYTREIENYSQAADKLKLIRGLSWRFSNIFDSIQGFLMIALEMVIFYIAIKLWFKDVITIGDFVLIQAYLLNIFMRLWDFGNVIRRIYSNLADAEEMTEVLNTDHEVKDIKTAKNLVVNKGKIEFKDVIFNYNETRSIFKKFNLIIKAGERLAVIGSSGAGKTTIVKLILRMHNLDGGKILIDNQDISKVNQESLWHNVSLVPQDPILFHRTLMENIRYGKPEATDDEVYQAAKAANCHNFIQDTAEGYDTYVGERGIKLSGGERQRIAIARAILRNAPILILDEATSSLDSKSEKLIQDALDYLMKNKTVIVVAHRLSTIRKMDRIVVIIKGAVVEEGSHKQLIKKADSVYKKHWELQAGGFIK